MEYVTDSLLGTVSLHVCLMAMKAVRAYLDIYCHLHIEVILLLLVPESKAIGHTQQVYWLTKSCDLLGYHTTNLYYHYILGILQPLLYLH